MTTSVLPICQGENDLGDEIEKERSNPALVVLVIVRLIVYGTRSEWLSTANQWDLDQSDIWAWRPCRY